MEIKEVRSSPYKRFKKEWERSDRESGHVWDRKSYYFQLYDKGIAAGYSTIITTGGVSKLKELIVGEGFRGSGYGEALMKHFIDFSRSKRCRKLVLFTSERHIPAMKLYAKLGFKVESKRPRDMFNITWYIYAKYLK
jgi:[ribosomal protein S18]-alanine N-acetyltransferase